MSQLDHLPQVDKYMEERFGKPDFSRSYVLQGIRYTPMGTKYRLWRVDIDKSPDSVQ